VISLVEKGSAANHKRLTLSKTTKRYRNDWKQKKRLEMNDQFGIYINVKISFLSNKGSCQFGAFDQIRASFFSANKL
jgi:hypothetical protein